MIRVMNKSTRTPKVKLRGKICMRQIHLSLEDSHKEWRKRVFEGKTENIYDMKTLNDMNFINVNKVNYLYEFNLLHDKPYPSRQTKNTNGYYPLILHVCMNTRRDKEKSNNFRILLYSGFSSTVVMKRITTKIKTKKYSVIQYHTHPVKLTINLKVKLYFI